MNQRLNLSIYREPKPKLSVIVVSFNTCQLTLDCIESVYEATKDRLEVEVIVVDNASNDGSAEAIASAYPSCDVIRNERNIGFAAANNQAFRVATAPFVLLLNSDTLVLRGALERSVDYMNRHPEVGAFSCRVLNSDGTVQRVCSQFPSLINLTLQLFGLDKLRWPIWLGRYQMRDWARDSVRDVEVISGCFMLVRSSVIDEVGNLDERFFFFGEETDWCVRIRSAGWKLRFAPVGEIIHHGGGSSKTLAHSRDVMLSSAIIRLHRKHSGHVAAAIAFLILITFNVSRAAFWWLRNLVSSNKSPRAGHFLRVSRSTLETWELSKSE